ncbi:Phospholipid-transporting ATPase IIB, putative [Giardia lamblia P15]|uniref:Phospholipid-transporting ATPase IIB, putative n=1 Tax=Giardia intestinalis (strain P15) TaxID=658858 RepID=E1F7C3_GIAIA|nr:Phospholipid-transporting ATPase IIB, putative [Giardia lamblia P15]
MPTNKVKTRKYNWVLFPFIAVFKQFRLFFNQFFLVLTFLQLYRPLQVGLAFTYYLPLCFIVLVSVGRELYDELNRARRDKLVNSGKYNVIGPHGLISIKSEDIKVGNIVLLEPNQRIPADIVVLQAVGHLYVKTINLDGETDLKVKMPLLGTVDSPETLAAPDLLSAALDSIYVTYAKPSDNLYYFSGALLNAQTDAVIGPITASNAIWMNCSLARGYATGLVVYTGKSTRIMQNLGRRRIKQGSLDVELNMFVKGMFIFCLLLSALVTLATTTRSVIVFIRWIIILSSIIPLAMQVSYDFGKLVMAGSIKRDDTISGIEVRSTDLAEELGRISHVFSDKTGTLTRNEMWLHEIVGEKKLSVSVQVFDNNVNEFQRIVLFAIMTCHNVELFRENQDSPEQDTALKPRKRKQPKTRSASISQSSEQGMSQEPTSFLDASISETIGLEDRSQPVRTLSLYNSPTELLFTHREVDENLILDRYIGSSPDEVAIVRSMHARGYVLDEKSHNFVRYTSSSGPQEFELLHIFPFTSETKRMSVVTRHIATGSTFVFVKGADTTIEASAKYCPWLRNTVDALAGLGRRTLVYAYRMLDDSDISNFRSSITAAFADLTNRDSILIECEKALLTGVEILCVTGIEDQLQLNVKATIQDLKRAGIKFWMLTGDKVVTCLSIAQSCGLLPNTAVKKHTSKLRASENAAPLTIQSLYPEACKHPTTPSLDPVSVPTRSEIEVDQEEKTPIAILRRAIRDDPNSFMSVTSRKEKRLNRKKRPGSLVLASTCYGRLSEHIYFLTEELTPNEIVSVLKELYQMVSFTHEVAIVIDGPALEKFLGNYPVDYFYTHAIHPITGDLLPLHPCIKIWRRFIRWLLIYLTGHPRRGKGSLGPDAETRELFASIASKAETVLCCRCTPTQKALVAGLISVYTGGKSLGIGDGANDVPLIETCSVGIGLRGKEGNQAANAADYVMTEFRGLKKLLLWYGKCSYVGSAQICQFIIQRGIALCLLQICFTCLYFFTSLVLHTGVLLLGYVTLFTMFPPFNYYINEDVDYQLVMKYPEIYRITSRGSILNLKTFFLWTLSGFIIAVVVFFLAYIFSSFPISASGFTFFSFAILLWSELCLILMTTHRFSLMLLVALLLSYLMLFLVVAIYPGSLTRSEVFSLDTFWRLCITNAISAVLLFVGERIVRRFSKPNVIRILRSMRKPVYCANCRVPRWCTREARQNVAVIDKRSFNQDHPSLPYNVLRARNTSVYRVGSGIKTGSESGSGWPSGMEITSSPCKRVSSLNYVRLRGIYILSSTGRHFFNMPERVFNVLTLKMCRRCARVTP